MQVIKHFLLVVLLAAMVGSGCMAPRIIQHAAEEPPASSSFFSTPFTRETTVTTLTTTPTLFQQTYRSLPVQARWQIQYTGTLNIDLDVEVFNLDLFDTSKETIEKLHQRGVFVMCYFSAGSYEDWRLDASLFPPEVLGHDMEGWPGERWLDIRRIDLLAPIMEARLDLARSKGCDGVDPDNVDGYTHDTGFPLTAEDQKRYNMFLAASAHQRGLLVGLKNDLAQIPELVSHFDWILNEECFSYAECDLLTPFLQAGKPVFVTEYELQPSDFCPQAVQMNINALYKNWELDAERVDCREWTASP